LVFEGSAISHLSDVSAFIPLRSAVFGRSLCNRWEPARPSLFPAGLIEHTRINDAEAFASPAGWVLDAQQLGHGKFCGVRCSAFTANVGVISAACIPGIMLRGAVPSDCALVAMPLSASHACHRGVELAGDAMLVLLSGEELDFRAVEPVEMLVVVCAEALLESHGTALLGGPIASARRDHQLSFESAPSKRHTLRALVSGIRHALKHDPSQLKRPFAAAQFDATIVSTLLEGVASDPIPQPNPSRRRLLAQATESYMRESLNAAITISDLCKKLETPERTLHLAFKEHFGTSPKAYLKMLRLNAVRRELRQSRGNASITDTAMKWGFWHLGWFAHHYKEMFGELPTQTVQATAVAAFG